MERQTIDGRNVVQEFIVLHHEWECDGYGWVTEDGRIWHTDHSGEPYEISPNDCLKLMDTVANRVHVSSRAPRPANGSQTSVAWRGPIRVHDTMSCTGRTGCAGPASGATATTLQPSRREPLHERPGRARRTDALHCARQGRTAVRQTFAETEAAAPDHERRGMMSSQTAAPPVLQIPELARPRRVCVPDLDPGAPGFALDRVAHLSRAEDGQHLGEALPIRTQPRLVGAQIQVLENHRTKRFRCPRDNGPGRLPDGSGPGTQPQARRTRRGGRRARPWPPPSGHCSGRPRRRRDAHRRSPWARVRPA